MRNFQDIFGTRKRSFISAFPICMTVPLNKGRFLHAKSRSCDNAFHATKFIYICITAICYVKTGSNDRCSETRFVLVWCMLFFINRFRGRFRVSGCFLYFLGCCECWLRWISRVMCHHVTNIKFQKDIYGNTFCMSKE